MERQKNLVFQAIRQFVDQSRKRGPAVKAGFAQTFNRSNSRLFK
ncbi:hypothetical protein LEP1GSC193_0399 [Leptospira alstonii serovar Pingchang str. 80-412]|uniref:Uncharacterized protein n=2 Tax=Leptospira alstonii TaxID=28452 RepID=M6CTA5_9LEPT|nr:hypothetical protein LEP1GSC194_2187 [Leptospira alstonii serovar Sichuan str. 79601]EQA80655.1 hypothetical protein LEP1GSC193_0399 [Leptospira alstonii serovar Pingchang str. 80-412]